MTRPLRARREWRASTTFSREHRAALTGQQFQSADNEPYYVLFEDFTHVKFYRRSLFDACVLEGARFDGFQHVDDWVSKRLVTATGPNPLPATNGRQLTYRFVFRRQRAHGKGSASVPTTVSTPTRDERACRNA